MFRDKLYFILSELSIHKGSKYSLLEKQIQSRLEDSLRAYIKSVDESYNYLSARDDLNVLKKLNRRTK